MIEDVLDEDDFRTISACFDQAWRNSRPYAKDMYYPDGRSLSRVQCRHRHIIYPAVVLLLPHIRKLVPGFRIEHMLEQYFYWLCPESTNKVVVGHLDGEDDQDVVALVFSKGASGVLGIQPIPGDLSAAELRAWLKVIILSNSLYLMEGNKFMHEVRLQHRSEIEPVLQVRSEIDRAILVLFVRRAPQNKLEKRGRPLLPSQKAASDSPAEDLVHWKEGAKHVLYHDDETCVILRRAKGKHFKCARTVAIEAGYAACQNCVVPVSSDDDDLNDEEDDAEEGDDDDDSGSCKRKRPDAQDGVPTDRESKRKRGFL